MIRRLVLSAALCLSLAGCGALPSVSASDASAGVSGTRTVPATAPAVMAVLPVSFEAPSIKAASTLVATGLNPDGTAMVPPVTEPLQASYLRWSDELASTRPLVIYGHVNGRDAAHHSVPGTFAKLNMIKPGDEVSVAFADGGKQQFRISRVERRPKDAFPTAEVYDATPVHEIRLVTCDGEFDSAKRSYVDNFIAFGQVEP